MTPDANAMLSEAAIERHDAAVDAGLLDPDEPTEWAHVQHVKERSREFTPEDRRRIRARLGL